MSENLQVDFSSLNSVVKLNVGGQHFTTTIGTLRTEPKSMLGTMFSGKHEVKLTGDGSVFFDRDGTYFRFILNYLRQKKLILPDGASFLRELKEEADFYRLQGMLDVLKLKLVFAESVILSNEEHRTVLFHWLPASFKVKGEICLLFRASRDGFAAKAFHFKCDNAGPTITVVKSGQNVFGGFTEKSWTSQGNWVKCNQAFLFSMVNPSGLGPTKMPIRTGKQQNAIYCTGSHGPMFGVGNDLFISNTANTKNDSFSSLGQTYQRPPGQQETFLTGAASFTVTDYEVFGLHQ